MPEHIQIHSAAKPLALGLALFFTAAAALVYAVRARRSQFFGPSVYRGPHRAPAGQPAIALTFDDGPSPGTVELARYLAAHNIRATFFVCGVNLLRHPEIARELHRAGHELGNHTFTHARLCPRLGWKASLFAHRTVFREFALTQNLIRALTGTAPRLLRAPYGLRWFGLRAVQRSLGLLGVHWTAIGYDWLWAADRIAAHLLAHACPGAILCLHDGRDIRPNPDIAATLQAVQTLVPALLARGYRFQTVSALLAPPKEVVSGRQTFHRATPKPSNLRKAHSGESIV